MYNYVFKLNDKRTFLFKSQFLFHSEKDCLSHYKKGILAGLFSINIYEFNQYWAELALWGLLGRCESVDLLNTLCAHGGRIAAFKESLEKELLEQSFKSVQFHIKMTRSEFQIVEKILGIPLGKGGFRVYPFLYLQEIETLIIGSYFLDDEMNSDLSFPIFIKKLEKDHCFERGAIQKVLVQLFYLGFKIEALEESGKKVLAEYDLQNLIIKGEGNEETLFYVGLSKAS